MKAIVPPLSALLLILAGLGVAPQLARADVMYQCVDESGHKSFSNIRYFPVASEHVSSIKIELCDSLGQRIEFGWGNTIVTLSFKRFA